MESRPVMLVWKARNRIAFEDGVQRLKASFVYLLW